MITLRNYQIDCKNAIETEKQNGIKNQLCVLPTGTGKRLIATSITEGYDTALFLAHTEELVQQAYDEFEAMYPMRCGIVRAEYNEMDKPIVIGSIQTMVRRYEKFPKKRFQIIHVDECFPAGTLIDGIPIEKINVGDEVSSFNHHTNSIEKRKVISVFEKRNNSLLFELTFTNGQKFTCTANHPIFTKKYGYILAEEMYYAYHCSKMMCYGKTMSNILFKLFAVWETICSKTRSKSLQILFGRLQDEIQKKENGTFASHLQRVWGFGNGRNSRKKNIHKLSSSELCLLFHKMQKGEFLSHGLGYNVQNKQKIRFGQDEEKQSNVDARNQRENDCQHARKNIFSSWRKRRTNKTTVDTSSIDRTSNGICCNNSNASFFRKIFAKLLQSRFGLSRSKTINRSGWTNSRSQKMEVLGQTKNGSFEFVRLDSIKIQKQRSRRKSSESSEENYVYNIEVEKNNNYFANSILVHNCHHYLAKTFIKPLRYFEPELMLGWSATPTRLDNLSMSNLFDKIVFDYPIGQAIEEGWLCELDAVRIKTQIDLSKLHRVAGDFNQAELSAAVDIPVRNQMVVDKYKEYAAGRQAVVFCVDIQHCVHMVEVFRKNGLTADLLVSDKSICTDRSGINDAFQNGDLDVLCNVNICTEGWDYSDVGCVLMARPTQSKALYIQAIGRGARRKSKQFEKKFGKNDCIILDFVDNCGKHTLVNTWTLDRENTIEKKIYMSREKKEKALTALIEKARKQAEIRSKFKNDKKIDLLALPKTKVWHVGKNLEPATEKQIMWLKREGVYEEGCEYTKGQASELISQFPATEAQLRMISRLGYDVSFGLTIGQVDLIMKEQNESKENGAPFGFINNIRI